VASRESLTRENCLPGDRLSYRPMAKKPRGTPPAVSILWLTKKEKNHDA
jgi:hypothetical protein